MIKLIYSRPWSLSDIVSKEVLVWSRLAYEIERCQILNTVISTSIQHFRIESICIWCRSEGLCYLGVCHVTHYIDDEKQARQDISWLLKKFYWTCKETGIFQQPTSGTPLDIWYHVYFRDRAQCTSSSLVLWMGNLWILCTLDDICCRKDIS